MKFNDEFREKKVHRLFFERSSRVFNDNDEVEVMDKVGEHEYIHYPKYEQVVEFADRLYAWLCDNYVFGTTIKVPSYVLGRADTVFLVFVMDELHIHHTEWCMDDDGCINITISWYGYSSDARKTDVLRGLA